MGLVAEFIQPFYPFTAMNFNEPTQSPQIYFNKSIQSPQILLCNTTPVEEAELTEH